MTTPYRFLTRFNKHILPITAPFLSGYILGYMVSDVEAHTKFQKYRPVHIKAVPFHNFYVYARNSDDYKNCVAQLDKVLPSADLRSPHDN